MGMFENVLTRFDDKIVQTDNISALRLYWTKFINLKFNRLIGLYDNKSSVPKFPESKLLIFSSYYYTCKHKTHRKVLVVEQFFSFENVSTNYNIISLVYLFLKLFTKIILNCLFCFHYKW